MVSKFFFQIQQLAPLYAQDRAVSYLMNNLEQVANWGDILQTVVLDLIRKVCRTDPTQKGKYIKIILMLLSTNNTSVIYEVGLYKLKSVNTSGSGS